MIEPLSLLLGIAFGAIVFWSPAYRLGEKLAERLMARWK